MLRRAAGFGRPDRRPVHDDAARPWAEEHLDALLVAAGRGDLDAFAAFYDRTAPLVYGMLCDALGHPDRAERVTARVYVQLWYAAPTLDARGRSALATLLHALPRGLR